MSMLISQPFYYLFKQSSHIDKMRNLGLKLVVRFFKVYLKNSMLHLQITRLLFSRKCNHQLFRLIHLGIPPPHTHTQPGPTEPIPICF